MQCLFITTELVGNIDCIERYSSYLHFIEWCTNNIDLDQWELDYTITTTMCDNIVAGAFRIKNMQDAIKFALA